MDRFCPKCGKIMDLEVLKRYGKCASCYYDEHPLFTIENPQIRIQICPVCFKFRNLDENEKIWHVPDKKNYKDVWIQAIYYFLINNIENNMDLDFFIDFTRIPDVLDSGKKKKVEVLITGMNRVDGMGNADDKKIDLITREENITLTYSIGSCNDCGLKKVGYHNSVVQVREDSRREDSEMVLEKVVKEAISFSEAHPYRGSSPIASIKDVAGGKDIMLFSKNFGKTLANHLKKKFCATIKESFKVVGPDKTTGGNLTRMFFSVRLFPFRVGDVFFFEKSRGPELIHKITPDMIHLKSLIDGKVTHTRHETFNSDFLLFENNSPYIKDFQIVSINDDDTLNLMSLDNYEEFISFYYEWYGIKDENQNVKGFFYDNKLFLIPLELK
ncbi:MAG: NMD3-related protein [Candidatus Hodarchaeota archaeon]